MKTVYVVPRKLVITEVLDGEVDVAVSRSIVPAEFSRAAVPFAGTLCVNVVNCFSCVDTIQQPCSLLSFVDVVNFPLAFFAVIH